MNDPRFRLTPAQAAELVAQFGTPLYVLDEATLRTKMGAYRASFEGRLSFAAKANPISTLLAIAHSEGFGIDVASEGELRAALYGGVPASACTLHGNNKSLAEIQFGLSVGIGEIVVDNFSELDKLERLDLNITKLLLRLAPGVDPVTHEKISTGQEDTKFGFSVSGGDAERAVKFCLDRGLPLVGIHCHVGSQLLEPSAQIAGGEALARFAVGMLAQHGWRCKVLNVGGGLGVRYFDEEPMPIADYCAAIVAAVKPILDAAGLDPVLAQEPGRSLVAEAGVTLYTVGAVKLAAGRRYVVVDGGLAENPRPALYGAEYAVERVFPLSASEEGEICLSTPNPLLSKERRGLPTRLSGRHCETDTLIEDVDLPDDVQPGDILQKLATGAYSSSMASNYNRYPRPATVLLRGATAVVIQRAETQDELLAREQVPADLLQTRERS
ncbi:MAG: diaminopimelate decarboxylase [Methanoregulaceae archaeon]|nr:diaminopimelate decarboxylase [Methanoregulaceae archaeon]